MKQLLSLTLTLALLAVPSVAQEPFGFTAATPADTSYACSTDPTSSCSVDPGNPIPVVGLIAEGGQVCIDLVPDPPDLGEEPPDIFFGGLHSWFEDFGVTVVNNLVPMWDSKNNGCALIQSDMGDQPVFGSLSPSGLPGVGVPFNGKQWMAMTCQFDAPGEFYLATSVHNGRTGSRTVWGNTPGNPSIDYVSIADSKHRIKARIAGASGTISIDDAWTQGDIILEVWREADDSIHVRVNGQDVTASPPKIRPGLFTLSAIGTRNGGYSWDDTYFGFVPVLGPTTAAQHDASLVYQQAKWGI